MIAPYKRTPEPPTVALLTPQGEAINEHGEQLDLDAFPADTRIWCDYDTVRSLLQEGKGEALCWNREEISWRHRRLDPVHTGWKRRPSDVHVIRLPFYERHELTLRALAAWRDWLASYGASPTSTTGSAAWSLLRARLEQPLWTGMGDPPHLKQTMGGRQELGAAGRGSFVGKLAQLDLPAAYASELGNLSYGGHWFRASELAKQGARHDAEWWAREGRPVFVRAFVRVPDDLRFGPLPRRNRSRIYGADAAQLGQEYPLGTRLQGVWTWQELEAAASEGVHIVRIAETWVHLAGGQKPFLPWWAAIQRGREMPGLAGLLAKMTGNALWGRFAMDARHNGLRTIRSAAKDGRMLARTLPFRGGRPPAHDLAETVSGRVRSRLYSAMMLAGEDLLSAHTDGIWIRSRDGLAAGLPEWRRKQSATRLDLLSPQNLRYWPTHGQPQTVMSGVPALEAKDAFDRAWAENYPATEVIAA